MARVEEAKSLFAQGFSCLQAIMGAYAPSLGLDRETGLKLGAGFGGGMGRLGETCGAVTGAFMVLGLKHGNAIPGPQAKEAVYVHIRKFAERFKGRCGSLVCRDLLGCDLNTPEGYAEAQEKKLFATICSKYVQAAAEILEEML
jgi:C_GCAxxG_C_C family probable redox protein